MKKVKKAIKDATGWMCSRCFSMNSYDVSKCRNCGRW